jgi:cyclic beta-1,2-glucan synthetase
MGALAGWVPRRWTWWASALSRPRSLDLLRAWRRAVAAGAAAAAGPDVARRRAAHAAPAGGEPAHLLEWTTAEAAQAGLGTAWGHAVAAPRRRCWRADVGARPLVADTGPRRLTLSVLALWRWRRCWSGRPTGPAGPAHRAAAQRPRLAGRRGARHLAPVRALRGRAEPPPAARQPAGRALRDGGPPHLAHQHRPVPAEHRLRAPVRLDRHAGAAPRLEATLATLQQMERHRGHFLNWYDTETLQPLLPRYVSTVDSGNLCAHLLAVAQACPGWRPTPMRRVPRGRPSRARASGCRPPAAAAAGAAAPAAGADRLGRCSRPTRPTCETPWPAPTSCAAAGGHAELDRLLRAHRNPGIVHHAATRRRAALAAGRPPGHAALGGCWTGGRAGRRRGERAHPPAPAGPGRRLGATGLGSRLPLPLPPRRHLLHIGYRLDEQQLDTAFYDLLASESRTTSLLAIAKGDVPVRHWAALGRPFFASGTPRGAALLVGLDVRVPDAHAGAGRAARQRAARGGRVGAARAARLCARSGHALGHLGERLRRARPAWPTSTRRRACPAGAAPHTAGRARDRALRHRAGGAGRCRAPATTCAPGGAGRARALRLHRGAGLHPARQTHGSRLHPGAAPSWRTTRA